MRKLFALLFLFIASNLFAHPMGNFSISHYCRIQHTERGIVLRYIIDMAEIPSFQEMDTLDADRDKSITAAEKMRYADLMAHQFTRFVRLKINEQHLEWRVQDSFVEIRPSVGDLPTIVIYCTYVAPFNNSALSTVNSVEFIDENFPQRSGWREVVIERTGAFKNLDLPENSHTERSKELSQYPKDSSATLPQEMLVNFNFKISPAVKQAETQKPEKESTQPEVADTLRKKTVPDSTAVTEKRSIQPPVKTPSAAIAPQHPAKKENIHPGTARNDKLTKLITAKQLTSDVILFSVIIAFFLGSMHALSPGHGKAIVAGYLVGSRGTPYHAIFLGAVVTLTHTIGVFALGLITLFGSKYILPEQLYPWLGFLSGVSIVIIGSALFFKRAKLLRVSSGHSHNNHDHIHDHSHSHPHSAHHHDPDSDGAHSHEHHDHSHLPVDRESGKITWKSLLSVGITGGALPCPSALVVLLSAISLHRIGFGLILIIAFSLGLAVVLTCIGILFIYASRWTQRFHFGGALRYRLPLVSSFVITVLGCIIAVQSFLQI